MITMDIARWIEFNELITKVCREEYALAQEQDITWGELSRNIDKRLVQEHAKKHKLRKKG